MDIKHTVKRKTSSFFKWVKKVRFWVDTETSSEAEGSVSVSAENFVSVGL